MKFKIGQRDDGRSKAIRVCHPDGSFFGNDFKKSSQTMVPPTTRHFAVATPVHQTPVSDVWNSRQKPQDKPDTVPPKHDKKKQLFEIKISKNDEFSLVKFG